MIEYFLSSHASLNAQHKIAVPFQIVFYTPPGTILNHERVFQVFRNLVKQVTPGGKVDHRTNPEDMVPNYAIWELSEYPDYSGVFPVGSDHASVHLTRYTENNPLRLSELIPKLTKPSKLYWVACS